MKPFYFEESDYTPKADFNYLTGVFELDGVSRPENVSAFYIELTNWLREFEKQCLQTGKWEGKNITVNFKLNYCNSASSKYILQLLEIIKSWISYDIVPVINWYYDESDETMKEDGQDLADALEYEFNFLTIS
jgi:hypothetical protein